MSTVYLGTSDFAAGVLERLAGSEAHRPALVLTRPDRPSGRGRRLQSPPVAERARELGIAVAQPESVNDPSTLELIARAAGSPDGGEGAGGGARGSTLVICAFGALITEPLLSAYPTLNVHPSLLPRWRGAAPVERAIMAGDRLTGVSIMRLTAGLDSGPVCLCAEERIRAEDTYGTLSARLRTLGGELLLRTLDEEPPCHEQPEDGVTYAEKISPAERLLAPTRPARELERVLRALTPHIGARVELADGSFLGVREAALREQAPAASGGGGELGVIGEHGRLFLRCADGALELLVVQPPGGRSMGGPAYLRGHGAPGRR